MNYYELIKEYGKGKGEAVMWEATKRVSDMLEAMKETHKESYWKLIKETYAIMNGPHYNEDFAEWQIEQMYFKDKQGNVHHAPHWTKAEYKTVFDAVKNKVKDTSYNCWDFAVTLEMLRSDWYCLLKEWMPNDTEEEIDKHVVEMSLVYLNDDDGEEGKIWKRFNK